MSKKKADTIEVDFDAVTKKFVEEHAEGTEVFGCKIHSYLMDGEKNLFIVLPLAEVVKECNFKVSRRSKKKSGSEI